MAQPLSLPSSARSKSSEKSISFFFAVGSVGMEGSFGASVANVEAVRMLARVRQRRFMGERERDSSGGALYFSTIAFEQFRLRARTSLLFRRLNGSYPFNKI